MSDPLADFDWRTIYARYDAACRGFDPNSKHLRGSYAKIPSDRLLYYKLETTVALENRSQLDADWYEALLYWKLYSQRTLDSRIADWGRFLLPGDLQHFLAKLPTAIPREVQDIIGIIELLGKYQFPGMKSATALPVRTTLLHILYPNTVPIFDQMVLKAVGAWHKGANQKINVFANYIPYAWELADKYTNQLSGYKESPVRLVDMALWVKRS
jgi:hypothetical protein